MMHLLDAVGRVKGWRYYCHHHEQAAAMAAEGYARQSGSLAVCYATQGPGATNLLTGLAGAWLDSSPVLFLTGQSRVAQTIRGTRSEGLRQFGTFEVDIVPIVQSVTKYAAFLDDPSQVRFHLEKALHLATSGRPGPVLLDVPLDVQGALVDAESLAPFEADRDLPAAPGEAEARTILAQLHSARRPLILGGHGVRCARAVASFQRLVHQLQIPVVTTQLAKDLLPYSDPMFVGHPGVRGDRAGNFAVQNADLILSIGCSLHSQNTGYEHEEFAPKAYKIQVEIDPAMLEREQVGVSRKVLSDTAAFLAKMNAVAERLASPALREWRQRSGEWKTRHAATREPHRIDQGPVNFYEFAAVLSDQLQGGETIVTDAGSAYYVMGQAFRLKGRQRYLVSGALGAMGWALPASLGVCAADPEVMAICVTGDGSLQTNLHELQTLKHYGFNVKAFIINNEGYASIRNTQRNFFDGHIVAAGTETGVTAPPLDRLAEAFGLPYVDCANSTQLRSAVCQTLLTPGPVLCGITGQTDQQILPGVQSVRLADGRMASRPLHDMVPSLGAEELRRNMCW
jgi:acetolactate synthase-1/2/3 large subunit